MIIWRSLAAGMTALLALACLVADTGVANEAAVDRDVNADRMDTAEDLRLIPPDGFDSLSEDGFQYFQTMGPLEYAARLGGVPDHPVWQARLSLHPQDTGEPDGFTYRVKLDHYNFSSLVYQELVNSYGAENVDPTLNNQAAHQHFELTFIPVMGIAADWLPESTQLTQSSLTRDLPGCVAQDVCADAMPDEDAEWAVESTIQLAKAPWETEVEPLYAMVRALANQAGWLQVNGSSEQWQPGEIPEGTTNRDRPWVAIQVSNYAGNGGFYVAEWIERVADDSIASIIHRVYYNPNMGTEAFAVQSVICARGVDTGKIRAVCP